MKKLLIGLLLLAAGLGVLLWNENQLVGSDLLPETVVIDPGNVSANSEHAGKLVWATGQITGSEEIGDELYLKPGPYLSLEKNVETFESEAWKDTPSGDSGKAVQTARLEQYSFSPEGMELPEYVSLSLSSDMLTLTQNASLANNLYVYVRNSATGTYDSPQAGDVRVSYQVIVLPFEGTILGKLTGTSITPFYEGETDAYYRVFEGSRTRALTEFDSGSVELSWSLRLAGVVLMTLGLLLLMGLAIKGFFFKVFTALITAVVVGVVIVVVSAITETWVPVLGVAGVVIALMLVGIYASRRNQLKAQEISVPPEQSV